MFLVNSPSVLLLCNVEYSLRALLFSLALFFFPYIRWTGCVINTLPPYLLMHFPLSSVYGILSPTAFLLHVRFREIQTRALFRRGRKQEENLSRVRTVLSPSFFFIILCEGKLKVPFATYSASSPRVRGAFPYGVRPRCSCLCVSPRVPCMASLPLRRVRIIFFTKKVLLQINLQVISKEVYLFLFHV